MAFLREASRPEQASLQEVELDMQKYKFEIIWRGVIVNRYVGGKSFVLMEP